MKNREVYRRDPDKIVLLNNGVAAMTDAETDDDRRTLRFELEHFVCEGQYRAGLVRILDAYMGNQGSPSNRPPGSADSSAAANPIWRRCCGFYGRITPFPGTAPAPVDWRACRTM